MTWVLALMTVVAVLALPVLADRASPRRLAVGGGLAYGLGCLACWLGARLLTGTLPAAAVQTPLLTAGLALVGLVVLAAQAAVPLYASRRYGAVAPLVALAVATALVVRTFLLVRGETDPLALYALVFGPAVVGGLAVLAGVERGVRRYWPAGG